MAEHDKFASYGNVGPHRVIPFVLEEFGAMGPKTVSGVFPRDCAASAVKTASTSRVRPPRGLPARGPRIGGSTSLAVDAGAAAAVAERDKFASYGNVGPHRVIPFVLEEFGAMHGPQDSGVFPRVLPAP
eukprot:jgi/Mesvir1/27612/Mv07346-RA.1